MPGLTPGESMRRENIVLLKWLRDLEVFQRLNTVLRRIDQSYCIYSARIECLPEKMNELHELGELVRTSSSKYSRLKWTESTKPPAATVGRAALSCPQTSDSDLMDNPSQDSTCSSSSSKSRTTPGAPKTQDRAAAKPSLTKLWILTRSSQNRCSRFIESSVILVDIEDDDGGILITAYRNHQATGQCIAALERQFEAFHEHSLP